MIENYIFTIREHRVMLSLHLAKLYGVQPKALIQAVKRNKSRFPHDFMFRLSVEEYRILRSQIVTLEKPDIKNIPVERFSLKQGQYSKYPPYAFTEQGVAMLSSALKSGKAIHANIAIMRAFVKLKEAFSAHKELSSKLNELETKVSKHDKDIQDIFEAIRQLMKIPEKPKRQIGFHAN